MEKIDKYMLKEYWPLVVHVDILEKIVDIFGATCGKVEIQTDEYIFDSISELKAYFKDYHPESIKIVTPKPYCVLELNSKWAKLYVSSSTTEYSGIFYKINDILLKAQRRPNFAYSYYFMVIAPNIVFLAEKFFPKNIIDNYLIFTVQLLLYTWAVWGFFIRLKKYSKIDLKAVSRKPGFFSKHADQIILSIIVAAVTTFINIFGQELVKKIWPEGTTVSIEKTQNIQK